MADNTWLVDVTDPTGLIGDQVQVDAPTEAAALSAALDVTLPNLVKAEIVTAPPAVTN